MKVLGFFLVLISIASCNLPKEAKHKKLSGINGEAVYFFNKENEIALVFKETYRTKEYQVSINSDTIAIGSDFVGYINVPKEEYEIMITSPSEEVILSDSVRGSKEYHFLTDKVGIFDFKGRIKYDTVEVSFEYKFVVVDKKV